MKRIITAAAIIMAFGSIAWAHKPEQTEAPELLTELEIQRAQLVRQLDILPTSVRLVCAEAEKDWYQRDYQSALQAALRAAGTASSIEHISAQMLRLAGQPPAYAVPATAERLRVMSFLNLKLKVVQHNTTRMIACAEQLQSE